jgi:hypothetical protein
MPAPAPCPPPKTDLRSWQTVRDRLTDFAKLGEELAAAIEQGDYPRSQALVNESRKIRAAMARAQVRANKSAPPLTPEGIGILIDLRAMQASAKHTDALLELWRERELPKDEILEQSPEGQLALADRFLGSAWDVDADVAVIVGSGGKDFAHAMVKLGQKRLLVYLPEEHEELAEVADQESFADYPKEAIPVYSLRELKSAVLAMSQPQPTQVRSRRMREGVSPELHEALAKEVQEAFDALSMMVNTAQAFADVWLYQGIENLPHIGVLPSIHYLKDQLGGRPWIVVAPGPSLKKNVHLLKEVKGRAVIVSFSHTLSALHAAGVVPDLVLALDMQDLRYHFEGYPVADIPALLVGCTIHPRVYEMPAQRLITFAGNSSLDHWIYKPLGEDMQLSSGGSVAHTAFALGIKLGCDPILLVGQDLSFGEDGQYYVETSCDGGTRVEFGESSQDMKITGWSDGYANLQCMEGRREQKARPMKVPGYYGGEVNTWPEFAFFRRWFGDVAKHEGEEHGRVFYNCTEGGAHIDNFEHIPLRHAIDQLIGEPFDLPAILDATGAFDATARLRTLLGQVEDMIKRCDKCVAHAHRCVSLATKAARRPEMLARLDKAEKRLVQALRPALFISMHQQKRIKQTLDESRDAATVADTLKSSDRLFRGVIEAGKELRPRLVTAAKRLRAAIEARRTTPALARAG